jgi:predicted MPP superfamily phosphohydrolase
VYRTRLLVYGLATLGLGLIGVGQMDSHKLGTLWLLKCLGMVLNGPGVLLAIGLGGTELAYSGWGRLLSWMLTLGCLEPLLRWIERPARQLTPQPAQVTRRSFLVAGSGCAGAALLGSYGVFYEPHHPRLEQFRLCLPDLPPQLEGLRVVLMSDWHCGPLFRPQHLRPAMHMANQCRPDLVLLPGDFTSKSGRYFSEAAELAALLRPRISGGVLVSWGNHDYWHGLEPGLQMMPRAGCQILTNQSLVLTSRRELTDAGRGLWLCGLDDLWTGKPELARTLAPIPADQPRLVLSHNPDVAEEQQGPRVDLMLSGHTHGGQVRIPTLGTPVLPSRYGQKYASGWVQGPDYPVYVSRGLGASGMPVRLCVPPEVTLFELHRGDQVTLHRARLV